MWESELKLEVFSSDRTDRAHLIFRDPLPVLKRTHQWLLNPLENEEVIFSITERNILAAIKGPIHITEKG